MSWFEKKSIVAVAFLIGVAAATAPRAWAVRPPPPVTLRSLYGVEPPPRWEPARTALVLVDFQQEFFSGKLALPEAPAALRHAAQLTAWARRSGLMLVHVRQVAKSATSPVFAPGSPGTRDVTALEPRAGELSVNKSMLGAFSGTDLHEQLRGRGVDTLIVAGLMTHLAVQVTATDATALGYHVIVAADAVATRALPGAAGAETVSAELVQRATLATLADRVADVLTTPQIVGRGTSAH